MAAQSKAPARKKAGAARAETKKPPAAKTFAWRGIQLKLPDRLPATVAFDLADLETSEEALTPLFRFITGLIGSDQLARVRTKVAEDNDSLDDLPDILSGIVSSILDEYGMSVGE